MAIAVSFFLVSLPLKLISRAGRVPGDADCELRVAGEQCAGAGGDSGVMAWGGSLVQLMLFYSAMMLAGTVALNVWVVFRRKRWM